MGRVERDDMNEVQPWEMPSTTGRPQLRKSACIKKEVEIQPLKSDYMGYL